MSFLCQSARGYRVLYGLALLVLGVYFTDVLEELLIAADGGNKSLFLLSQVLKRLCLPDMRGFEGLDVVEHLGALSLDLAGHEDRVEGVDSLVEEGGGVVVVACTRGVHNDAAQVALEGGGVRLDGLVDWERREALEVVEQGLRGLIEGLAGVKLRFYGFLDLIMPDSLLSQTLVFLSLPFDLKLAHLDLGLKQLHSVGQLLILLHSESVVQRESIRQEYRVAVPATAYAKTAD